MWEDNDSLQAVLHLDTLRPYLHIESIVNFEKTLGRGLYPAMVFVEGGTFIMGDKEQYQHKEKDNPEHEVTVNSFKMSAFTITLRQFKAFMDATDYITDAQKEGYSWILTGENKGWSQRSGVTWQCDELGDIRSESQFEHPVIHVSWYDAITYCNWLSQKQGLIPVYVEDTNRVITINDAANGYRLPTEAEWEYAAGNGTKHTKYSWGNNEPFGKHSGNVGDESFKREWDAQFKPVNHLGAGDIFVGFDSGYFLSSPVGSFNPNTFGLYDMTGNVWEWCYDWYDADSYRNAIEINQTGATSGLFRVLRGGSWYGGALSCRVSNRSSNAPTDRDDYVGFRVILIS